MAALPVTATAAPSNDLFANRISVSGSQLVLTGSNTDATREINEPNHGNYSVWWAWTAPSREVVILDLTQTAFAPNLAVYTGTAVNALSFVAGNLSTSLPVAAFFSNPGTTYQIAVGSYSGSGDIVLQLMTLPEPANDAFDNRTRLTGPTNVITASNLACTKEPGEPAHADFSGGRSVWWSWTAPAEGIAVVDLAGSHIRSAAGVYTGSVVSSLTPVARSAAPAAGAPNLLTFRASAGIEYSIAVDDPSRDSGLIRLAIRQPVGAPEIIVPPASKIVGRTDAVLVAAIVAGTEPITFEWRFEGEPLPGATSSILSLPSALEAHVGSYQFVARNEFGSVTSAPITLGLATNIVQFASTNLTVLEGDALTLTLTRSGFTNALQARYTLGGTAMAGIDYVAPSGFVQFALRQTNASIILTTIDDARAEPDRAIVLTVAPSDNYSAGPASSVEVTQVDDDPNVRVWPGDDLVRAIHADPGSFVFRRTGSLDLPLRVSYTVSGSARPGIDYEPLPLEAAFASGESDVAVPVRPLFSSAPGDTQLIVELAENAFFRIRSPSQASLTILANRSPQLRLIQPVPWQSFGEGQAVLIRAAAADPDGTVHRVEFFDGLKFLGRVTEPPYEWISSPSPGLHVLLARATDNLGASSQSEPLYIRVEQSPGIKVISPLLQPGAVPSQSTSAPGDSMDPQISRDGRFVAFTSLADGLTSTRPYRTSLGNALQVYVADAASSTVTLVSHSEAGGSGAGDSSAPVLSARGERVVFESSADNLAAYDLNLANDVFVWQKDSGRVRLISSRAGTTNASGNGPSINAAISGDGQRVVFQSLASDLASNDGNAASDVFVWDALSERTELVSLAASGTVSGNAASDSPVISDDGKRVAFLSRATNLVTEAPPLERDVLVRDLDAKVTWSAGREVPAILKELGVTNTLRFRCYNVTVSADGRFAAFKAASTSYSGPVLVLHHDLDARTTTLVASNAAPRLNSLNDASSSALSADGQVLAYQTTNHIYAWDARTRARQLVSASPDGSPPAFGRSWSPVLSADGRVVVFFSDAPGLVDGVVDGRVYTYLRRLDTELTTRVSLDLSGNPASFLNNQPPSLSGDGELLAFSSPNPALAAGDFNQGADVFRRAGGTNQLLSMRADGEGRTPLPIDDDLGLDQFSSEGRFVVFSSLEAWTKNDANQLWDVFHVDRLTGAQRLVSVNTNGGAASGASYSPAVSANGQVIAFISSAGDLAQADSNRLDDVFVRDLAAGRTVLVSSNRFGFAPSYAASSPIISADGEWVGFVSSAADLVPVSNPGPDLFLRRWRTGELVRITNQWSNTSVKTIEPLRVGAALNVVYLHSQAAGLQLIMSDALTQSNIVAGPVLSRPAVTLDGRFAAFRLKQAPEFPARIIDFSTGQIIASTPTGLSHTNLNVMDVALSEDGRRVAFVSAYDLDPARDANRTNDVYVLNSNDSGARLASVDLQGVTAGNAPSAFPLLSPDGRFLAFRSRASNLVPGRVVGENLYVRDLAAGKVWLVAGLNIGPGIGSQVGASAFLPFELGLLFRTLNAESPSSHTGFRLPILTFSLETSPDQDIDGDAIEDGWEMRQFGDLQSDGSLDRDQDGLTDLQEYWAGTDPAQPNSGLAISFIQRDSAGRVRIEWPAVSGREYHVEAAANLETGPWETLASGIRPATPLGWFEEQPSEAARRFYRVVVTSVPMP